MIAAFLQGITLGLILAISVGPVIFSIIKQSLTNGYKAGLAFVLGVSASDSTLVLMSQLFAGLFENLKTYEKNIAIGGSLLLMAVGIYTLFLKKDPKGEVAEITNKINGFAYVRIAVGGYLMNTLNPGVIVFWLTISTSIVSDTTVYRWTMFITCLAFVLCTDITKVFLAGRLRQKLTAHNIHVINKVAGAIITLFGVGLFLSAFYGSHFIHKN